MYLVYKYMHEDSEKTYVKMIKVHEGCLIFLHCSPISIFSVTSVNTDYTYYLQSKINKGLTKKIKRHLLYFFLGKGQSLSTNMGVCSVSMLPPKGRLHFCLRRRTKKKLIWTANRILQEEYFSASEVSLLCSLSAGLTHTARAEFDQVIWLWCLTPGKWDVGLPELQPYQKCWKAKPDRSQHSLQELSPCRAQNTESPQ